MKTIDRYKQPKYLTTGEKILIALLIGGLLLGLLVEYDTKPKELPKKDTTQQISN